MSVQDASIQMDDMSAASDDTSSLARSASEPTTHVSDTDAAREYAPIDPTEPVDAAAPDTADQTAVPVSEEVLGELAYQMFEGQGALEDVLSAYLDSQPQPESVDLVETTSPTAESVDLTPVDAPQDPLGYLATSDDIEKHSVNTGHVI
jgi:hypothetical protein